MPPKLGSDVERPETPSRRRSVEHDVPEVEANVMGKYYPSENVFSYFALASPKEYKRKGVFTMDACMSYFLAIATIIIQSTLVYIVYNDVVIENSEWQHSIMNLGAGKPTKVHEGEAWDLIAPLNTSEGACNDGQSLCSYVNGTYSCAPPSVQLTARWDELDVDKDGFWTHDEVMSQRDRLKCKYVVDPLEIFEVYVNLLKKRREFIWIHPDIEANKAIPKAYFDYAKGDIILCGYRNEDMCGNLLQRGVFDVPLSTGKVPRVGDSINSALAYCRKMLQPRGTCEVLLPSTYSTWKIESVAQCHGPKYNPFVYTHPKKEDDMKSLLKVDYNAVRRFARAKTGLFKTYKGIMVGFWILLIVSTLRSVVLTLEWIRSFPTEEVQENFLTVVRRSISEKHADHHAIDDGVVKGITTVHRVALYIVTIGRTTVLIVLLFVGLSFLGRNTDYIGLLLDGVALVWIVEIAEILYSKVIRLEVRDQWMDSSPLNIKPMEIHKVVARYVSPQLADWLWLVFVVVFTVGYIAWYSSVVVEPLYEALECSCVSEGKYCRESMMFSKEFWDQYWKYELPAAFKGIEDLRNGVGASSYATQAAGSLLRRRHHHHFHMGDFRIPQAREGF